MRGVIERYKKLDVLVNNAGVALAKDVEHTTLADWRWLTSINLDGVFLGTKHAILTMKANGSGSIVNLSSIEKLVGDPNLAAYNASKGGVRLLTKSAALYCAKAGYNIRVNSVHPGYIWTRFGGDHRHRPQGRDPGAERNGCTDADWHRRHRLCVNVWLLLRQASRTKSTQT